MKHWELPPEPASAENRVAVDLLQHVGQQSFSNAILARINGYFPVGSCSLYRIWLDKPPRLLFSHSFQRPDVTQACFDAYEQQGLYRTDRSFIHVRPERLALLHSTIEDFWNPLHRELVYRRNQVRERLSLARKEADGSVTSINLYAHDEHLGYTSDDIACFHSLAPLLLAGIERHIQLPQKAAAKSRDDTRRARLLELDAQMTTRELDICERILKGMTYDGIAAELSLSRSTVITYRNRAFARLNIHFKNQLFALCADPSLAGS